MPETKQDMSKTCEFKYQEKREMSQEEWQKWYDSNCAKCQYMCEICMYGEK